MPDPWEDLERAGDWLLGLEAEFRPDVVHLNHLVHADLPWQAPVLSVGHSCVLSWWAAVRGGPAPADWDVYRERVTRSLRAAQCVAAPSRAMLIELQRYYGPLRNCVVIPNCRDASRFSSASAKEPFVLSAGRLWDEAKNVAALARVAARIQWPVYVAGVATAPGGGTACFPGVRMLGPQDTASLRQWYARAGIYALPARYEPFGLTPVEAGLSECALVLGDIASLREVWGDAALYVDPDDHDGLALTLGELAEDSQMRRVLGARALARARELAPERFVSAYRTAYRKLLEDSRRADVRAAAGFHVGVSA
jgi:glycosyltransferase involved in cell wall biosynthesis